MFSRNCHTPGYLIDAMFLKNCTYLRFFGLFLVICSVNANMAGAQHKIGIYNFDPVGVFNNGKELTATIKSEFQTALSARTGVVPRDRFDKVLAGIRNERELAKALQVSDATRKELRLLDINLMIYGKVKPVRNHYNIIIEVYDTEKGEMRAQNQLISTWLIQDPVARQNSLKELADKVYAMIGSTGDPKPALKMIPSMPLLRISHDSEPAFKMIPPEVTIIDYAEPPAQRHSLSTILIPGIAQFDKQDELRGNPIHIGLGVGFGVSVLNMAARAFVARKSKLDADRARIDYWSTQPIGPDDGRLGLITINEEYIDWQEAHDKGKSSNDKLLTAAFISGAIWALNATVVLLRNSQPSSQYQFMNQRDINIRLSPTFDMDSHNPSYGFVFTWDL